MEDRHLQMVMAATGDYSGGIDGILGPGSVAGMMALETRHRARYTFDPETTTDKRRKVAALQAGLDQSGFAPGDIDGWWGVHTEEALNAFLFKHAHGRDEEISRDPAAGFDAPGGIPTQSQVEAVYGTPGAEIQSRLTRVELPFSLRLDWNLRQKVSRLSVHRDCADQLKAALIAVHAHYGADGMRELGIDRYAGGYNHRKMRGGSKWSMHAYGCAVDFYAAPNGLRARCPQALFCKDAYQPFLDIMQAHEWLPALRLWGADAMHFQRARLD